MSSPSDSTQHGLAEAFRATRYVVESGAASFEVRIGYRHDELDRTIGGQRWGIVTAYNPGASRHTRAFNRQADAELERRLRSAAPEVLMRTVHRDPGRNWPDEAGWLFSVDDPRTLEALACEFGQVAVVIGEPGKPAALHFLRPDHPDTDLENGSTDS